MLTVDELENLSPEERAAYEEGSMIDRAIFTSAWRRNKGVAAYREGPKPPTSLMRTCGMAGSFGFFLFGVFAFLATAATDGEGMLWLALCSSLFGISVFMWMLGAIEHRLILINETLKRQG